MTSADMFMSLFYCAMFIVVGRLVWYDLGRRKTLNGDKNWGRPRDNAPVVIYMYSETANSGVVSDEIADAIPNALQRDARIITASNAGGGVANGEDGVERDPGEVPLMRKTLKISVWG
jgi:hypothetical protein